MFGYVQANLSSLTIDEQTRYRAAYCGLCRTLGERHGTFSRLGLTYDLTFLALLLSSLYEPEEFGGEARCMVHPCKKHPFVINRYTEYAADMTIVLTYHKCMDDWQDERRLSRKCYASLLVEGYEKVRKQWPEQCAAIENGIAKLSRIEAQPVTEPDAAANCFGELMGSIFVYQKDHWEPQLRRMGESLGRYIYLADAAVDFRQDQKKGSYNPLMALSTAPEDLRPILMTILGEASEAFEILPLVQDARLLKNILYSGLWIKYNRGMQDDRKKVKT